MFEYWAHEASLIPTEDYPLWRWRMNGEWHWERLNKMRRDDPRYMDLVLEQVRARGPLKTSDLHDPGQRDGTTMWGWSKGKVALEALFLGGDITTSHRPNFVRMYDLSERVIPLHHLQAQGVERNEAQSLLLLRAARSLGVGTASDLADYHRIRLPQARPLVADLVAKGHLVPVEVRGWDKEAYLHPEATLPRSIAGRALLSPFDNLIWFRERVERLWDFVYRIEIYVPEPKRVHGYYVLPFMLDGHMVARVDLKTDRQSSRLRVKGAFAEPGVDKVRVGKELGEELETVAGWLGMEDLEIADNGDLARVLTLS
jgi:hypothetical protein